MSYNIRHRASPAEKHHSEHHSTRHGQHHDRNQLQQQVTQLERVVRLQNQVIVALSSCFVIVIISTLVLIQHLPHPNDDNRPFWSVDHSKGLQHDDINIKRHPLDDLKIHEKSSKEHPLRRHQEKKPLIELQANCSHSYGCSIRPVEIPQLHSTTHSLIASTDHFLLTHKSNRKKPAPVNQDRALYITSFADDATDHSKLTINPHGDFLIGIFDGHDENGHHVAQYASDEVPSLIASGMHNLSLSTHNGDPIKHTFRPELLEKIISQTFVAVDEKVPITGGGCTANVILRHGLNLFMANTGDSSSFIGIYHPPSHFDQQKAKNNENYIHSPRSPNVQLHLQGSVTIHHQNEKHKPHFPKEHDRIKSLGGQIHIPPKNPMGSRVITRSALHREDVGLAMSRSIGDWEWTAIGVIPDPDVVIVDLDKFWSENDIEHSDAAVFCVVGSDGLFDARKAEFIANHIAYGLFESKLSRERHDHESEETFANHLVDVGKKLVNMASPVKDEWYRDDITFVAKVVEL